MKTHLLALQFVFCWLWLLLLPMQQAQAQYVDLKPTNYPIPASDISGATNEVRYVAPDNRHDYPGTAPLGNAANDGSINAPWTLVKALTTAPAGATVVLRGGTYRHLSNQKVTNRIILQAYPGEKPWIKGSLDVSNASWVKLTEPELSNKNLSGKDVWKLENWNHNLHTELVAAYFVDAFPLADRRDMVFVNNNSLTQVASLNEVGADKFFVDSLGYNATTQSVRSTLYMGEDPAGKTVESTVYEHAFIPWQSTNLPDGLVIRGLGFSHYGTTPLEGRSRNIILENNTTCWNGRYGFYLKNCLDGRVKGNTISYNGLMGMEAEGMHGGLVEENTFQSNNWENFNPAWAACGLKFKLTLVATIRKNRIDNTKAAGLWMDIANDKLDVIENICTNNKSFGIFSEIGHRIKILGNVCYNNGTGIGMEGATYHSVWNNTLVDNGVAFTLKDDPRQNNPDDPTHFSYRYRLARKAEGMTWITSNNVIANNIYSSSTNKVNFKANQVHVQKEPNVFAPSATMVKYVDYNAYYQGSATRAPLITWKKTATVTTEYTLLETFKQETVFETNSVARYGGTNPYFTNVAGLDFSIKATAPAELRATRLLPDSIANTLGWARNTPVHMGAIQGAAPVMQAQTITFATLPDKIFGEAPFALSATASSGLPVSYSVVSGPATLSGDTLTLIGAGVVVVKASQSGNDTYQAALDVEQTFTVHKAGQTITFAPVGEKTYGDSAVVLSATTTSGLTTFDYTVLSGTQLVALTGNKLTIQGAGQVALQVIQPGNANYLADTATQTFTIRKAAQSLSFPSLGTYVLTGDQLTLPARATSGLPVSYSVSGPATLQGNLLHIQATGVIRITASQPGNENYLPASSLTQSVTALTPQADVVLALNAGGDNAYVSSHGIRDERDHYFTGGQASQQSGTAIAATLDDSLYQSQREGTFSYTIPLSSGVYEVYFHFAELSLQKEKSRLFTVEMEGKELIKSLDIYAQAGFGTAYRVSHTLLVKDGVLSLDFRSLVGGAQLSGLVIEKKTDVGVGGHGLSATYFNNMDFTGTHFSRRDAQVDFDWSQTSPHFSIEAESYSVRWSGQIHAQYSQTYTFYTQTDDGVRLWVNGVEVINAWNSTGLSEQRGTIALQAGEKYDIKLEYYQQTGGAVARLLWSSDSQPKQIIPQKRLFPVPTGVVSRQVATDLAASLSVEVFPNPASEVIHLQVEAQQVGQVSVSLSPAVLTNQAIHLPWSIMRGINRLSLPVKGLPSGMYVLAFRFNGLQIVKSIVIAH